jgi:hypothetical protein
MNIYTRLALEIIEGLGCHRAAVEQALAESDGVFLATLAVVSDRYYELKQWGLSVDERRQLDAQIKVELKRIQRWE